MMFPPKIKNYWRKKPKRTFMQSPEQNHSLFIRVCVAGIKLTTGGVATIANHFKKNLREEIKSLFEREIQNQIEEINKNKAETIFKSASSKNGERIVKVLENIFKVLSRVLRNHLEILKVMNEQNNKYNPKVVWDVIQEELQEKLKYFLDYDRKATHKPGKRTPPASPDKTKRNNDDKIELTFRFAHSNMGDVLSQPKTVEIHSIERELVEPSPYHITSIYRPVINFVDQSVSMLFGEKVQSRSSQNVLTIFMKNFVAQKFVEKVTEDTTLALKTIFQIDESPFGPQKLSSNGPQLLKCCIEVCDLLRRRISDFFALHHFDQNVLLGLLEKVNLKFVSHCQKEYGTLISNPQRVYSATLVEQEVNFLRNDPTYVQLIQKKKDGGMDSRKFQSRKVKVLLEFIDDKKDLDKERLLPINNFPQLSIISTSLSWLVKQYPDLLNPLSHKKTLYDPYSAENTRTQQPAMRVPHNVNQFAILSEKCLFMLHISLEIRCLFFLKNIKEGNYDLEKEVLVPQTF
eukprot:UN22351